MAVAMNIELVGLFVSAFLSATLLPGGSEALLAWLVSQGQQSLILLLLSATLGNVLGSMVTFAMGAWLKTRYPLKQLDKPNQQRARDWIERYGALALLLAWLPIVGDPLCFVAGWLGVNWRWSLLTITIGKSVRYCVIAGLFL